MSKATRLFSHDRRRVITFLNVFIVLGLLLVLMACGGTAATPTPTPPIPPWVTILPTDTPGPYPPPIKLTETPGAYPAVTPGG